MYNNKITDFTVDGKCSSCGRCCSTLLPIADHEIATIRQYVAKHRIREQRHNVTVGTDLTCPFRDEKRRICTIYPVRPAICREFKCDHTIEDVRRTKMNFHKQFKVVSMRKEFFGNDENEEFIAAFYHLFTGKELFE